MSETSLKTISIHKKARVPWSCESESFFSRRGEEVFSSKLYFTTHIIFLVVGFVIEVLFMFKFTSNTGSLKKIVYTLGTFPPATNAFYELFPLVLFAPAVAGLLSLSLYLLPGSI
jgi:hypothetical protein